MPTLPTMVGMSASTTNYQGFEWGRGLTHSQMGASEKGGDDR